MQKQLMQFDLQILSIIISAITLSFVYRNYLSGKPSLSFVQAYDRKHITLIIAPKSKPVEIRKIYIRRCLYNIPIGFRHFVEWNYPRNPYRSQRITVTEQDHYKIVLPAKCDSKARYKMS
jgi:hypothetical protein